MPSHRTCVVGGRLQTERLSNGKRKLLRDLVVEVDGDRFTVPKLLSWFRQAAKRVH